MSRRERSGRTLGKPSDRPSRFLYTVALPAAGARRSDRIARAPIEAVPGTSGSAADRLPAVQPETGVKPPTSSKSLWPQILLLLLVLYCFFVGLDLMGMSFKLFGKGLAETLIAATTNPINGLFIGILATTLVQSSSSSTSMVVALVAAGALTVEGAVPIVMGANIGTSVTNTIVALGHVSRKEEFRRAFAGATVHDFFNWLAVLVLLPLEIATGFLATSGQFLQEAVTGVGGAKLLNPLKTIVRPTAEAIESLLGESGPLVLIVGLGAFALTTAGWDWLVPAALAVPPTFLRALQVVGIGAVAPMRPALCRVAVPRFAHVGLVVDAEGVRLATRHGATSIASLREGGRSPEQVIGGLASSLGLTQTAAPIRAQELIERFELTRVSRSPFGWNSGG